jgi:hypothetical protein
MPDDNCEQYSARRSRCHDVYGKRGEECLHEELTEKRCLSMQRCPRQAIEYYGQQQNDNNNIDENIDYENNNHNYNKAICASWAESFAYINKELEHGENVARHHQKAHAIVSNDSKLRKECRQIAMDLAQCLRETNQKQKRSKWW